MENLVFELNGEELIFDGDTAKYYDGFGTLETVDGELYVVGAPDGAINPYEFCEKVIEIHEDELITEDDIYYIEE